MIVEGEKKGIWRYKKLVPAVVKEEVKVEEKKDVVVEPQPISETKPEAVTVSKVVPIAPIEVKVEEKKDVVVQPQTKSETKTQAVPSAATEVKKEQPKDPVDLFGTRVLKEDAFVYKEADDKSQRTWQLKKGTELTIISPGPEGWHLVRDAEKRKGYVKQDVLTNKPQ